MMGRHELKNRTQITTTVENHLHKKLQKLSKDTDIPMSRLIDRAITHLLSIYNVDNTRWSE